MSGLGRKLCNQWQAIALSVTHRIDVVGQTIGGHSLCAISTEVSSLTRGTCSAHFRSPLGTHRREGIGGNKAARTVRIIGRKDRDSLPNSEGRADACVAHVYS